MIFLEKLIPFERVSRGHRRDSTIPLVSLSLRGEVLVGGWISSEIEATGNQQVEVMRSRGGPESSIIVGGVELWVVFKAAKATICTSWT